MKHQCKKCCVKCYVKASKRIRYASENESSVINKKINMKLDTKHGSVPSYRILKVYKMLYKEHFGVEFTLTNWAMFSRTIKNLISLAGSEYKLSAILIIYFNWWGASGTDDKEHKYLEDKFFSIYLVQRNIANYIAYMENNLGLKTDEQVSSWVNSHLHHIGYTENNVTH